MSAVQRLSSLRASLRLATLAFLSTLVVAGCSKSEEGGGEGETEREASDPKKVEAAPGEGAARFDESWEDKPCDIVTTELVASTFGVPAADIEQSNIISSRCSYEWESGDQTLQVDVKVDVYDDVATAAKRLDVATRNMSAEEVAGSMKKIEAQAEATGKLDTAGKREAAKGVTGSVGAGGISFEDVAGVGDQARFDTKTGDLSFRVSNMRVRLAAFHGAKMQVPAKTTPDSIQQVVTAWLTDTIPERKEAAVKLAKGAVASL